MTPKSNPTPDSHLRAQAEAALRGHQIDTSGYSAEDIQRLIYELQVHQIELELQNEALQKTQHEYETLYRTYADLYNSAPVGYFTVDESSQILEANQTGATLLGMEKKALAGQKLTRFVKPEQQDDFYLFCRTVLKTDQVQQTDLQLLKADGTQFYASLEGQRVSYADSKFFDRQPGQRCKLTISDMSQRKEMEEELRSLYKQAQQDADTRELLLAELKLERNFILTVLNTAGALITVLDPEGRIVRFNRACEKISGYSFAEVEGQPFWNILIPPEEFGPVTAAFQELRSGQFPANHENRWLTKDGRRRLIAWSNTAIRDDQDRVQYVVGVGIDITEQREIEEAYQTLVDYSLQGLAILQDFRIVFTNQALARITGYSIEELLSLTFDDLKIMLHSEDRTMAVGSMQARLAGEDVPAHREIRFHHKDGSIRWVASYASRIEYRGQPAIQIAYIDITERKQADEIRPYLAAIVNSSNDAIIGKTLDSTIVSWNPGAEELYGYQADEIVGQSLTRLVPPDLRDEYHRLMEQVRRGERVKDYETHRLTKDGRRLIVSLTLSPIKNSSGSLIGVSATVRDITERKQTELRMGQLVEKISDQRRQLQGLTGQLAEAQEAERKALARELHDQVGQKLTGLNLNLNIIRSRLPKEMANAGPISSILEQSLQMIEETTERVQNVLTDLRPPVLDDYGLAAALQWYANELAPRIGFTIEVRGTEPEPRLAAAAEHALFRITQEALTNVTKHARATEVTITLTELEEMVRLVIADNGQGFEPGRRIQAGKGAGWGLITMIERAEAAGGGCSIRARPGEGTAVIVEMPQVELPK